MPIKKKSKQCHQRKSAVQSVKRHVTHGTDHRSADHCGQRASIEAQIAALENQLAALDQASDYGLQASGKTHKHIPEARSPKPEANFTPIFLEPPVLETVTATGARLINVSWKPVVNASGYRVQYSPDPEFQMNVSTVRVGVSSNATTLRGLRENTIYNVRVQAIGGYAGGTGGSAGGTGSSGGGGSGAFIDSMYSPEMTAVTGIGTDNETATHLQDWLGEMQTLFQNTSTLVPELDNTVLSPVERRRLLGSGVRRYGYIDQVSDVAADYPQFWPSLVSGAADASGAADFQDMLKERLREIEAMRNLLVWLRMADRVVSDMLLVTSNEAFRIANTYYASVRAASRSNLMGARQVFQLLQSFWKRPRRGSSEEPTQPTEPEVQQVPPAQQQVEYDVTEHAEFRAG
jgi:hypothetical protein